MLKKAGLVLVAVLAVLAIVVATRPAHFSISRRAVIHAPADVVYGYVSDLHRFQEWSPWAKLDPTMKTAFEGPASGVGSAYSWKGTGNVGEGKMTIRELRPPEHVAIDLEFSAPMEAKNLTELKLEPGADGTRVTWTMSGENGFMGKAFGLVMNMDTMVGEDFDRGLAQLGALSEAEAKRRTEAAKAAAPTAAKAVAPPAPVAVVPAPPNPKR